MPSVREKACEYSRQGQRRIYQLKYSKILGNANTLTKWIHPPRRLEILLKNRLGYRRSDMPKAGEEQVSKRNKKSSPGTTKPHSSDKSTKKSSIGVTAQPLSSRDAEESGQDRGGSPTSIKRCQTKSPNKGHHSQIANECTKILNVPLPLGPTRQAADTTDKRTAPSAAGLVNQQLRRRKKQIVNTLMAVILECLDKKLEALEEACDAGEHHGSRASHVSSSGSRGKPTSKTAGQKRQLHRDDQEDSSNEGGGEHPDRDKKRAKIVLEAEPGRFACPYYKYNQERFGNQRTCCGPGWLQVHRVKEHVKRSHGLPKHKCNRCCQLFREEDDLKTHQRQAKPCPVIDPASIPRDLADGFDQEQQDKLKSRSTKTSEEKWKEWYCILFNLDPKSDEIPSPYHDTPCDNRSLSGSGHDGNFKNYVEYYREQVTPVIYHHVEQEVEKAIMDVEEQVKLNVMNRIKGIPAMIHRLIQNIPPPPGEGAGTGFVEMPVPPDFNPDDIFEGLNFDEADGFDFDGIDGSTACFEATESSGSSSFSGSRYPMASSNTSVDDENYGIPKLIEEPYQQILPGLPEYDYSNHCYPV